jgi:hypothetical protein
MEFLNDINLNGAKINNVTEVNVINAIANQKTTGIVAVNTADSNTINNTTTETNFTGTGVTLTVPANSPTVGTKIKVTAFGVINRGATGSTLTIRLKIGATTLLASAARTMATDDLVGFKLEAWITFRTIGSTGTVSCNMLNLFHEGSFVDGSVIASNGTKTWDTTVNQTLQFSAQFGTAQSGTNITIENIEYEILRN